MASTREHTLATCLIFWDHLNPYYLTSRAERAGYHAEFVLAGRRVNEAMSGYVAGRVVETMSRAGIRVAQARILVLGFAFKKNCPDVRNTKVADLVASLEAQEATVDVFDPWIAKTEADLPVALVDDPAPGRYDAVVVAVAHEVFRALGAERIRAFGKPPCCSQDGEARQRSVVFDVKHLLPAGEADGRL